MNDDYATTPTMKSFARRYLGIIKEAYITTIDGKATDGFFDDYDKANAERRLQQQSGKAGNIDKIKKIRENLYSAELTDKEVASIDREEKKYLSQFSKKETVAEKPKKDNNTKQVNLVAARRNAKGR